METQHTQPPKGNDGVYDFTINYSGREIDCQVEKADDVLTLQMDNMVAKLQIEPDHTVHQIAGNTLPDSVIEYVKKEVLGHKA